MEDHVVLPGRVRGQRGYLSACFGRGGGASRSAGFPWPGSGALRSTFSFCDGAGCGFGSGVADGTVLAGAGPCAGAGRAGIGWVAGAGTGRAGCTGRAAGAIGCGWRIVGGAPGGKRGGSAGLTGCGCPGGSWSLGRCGRGAGRWGAGATGTIGGVAGWPRFWPGGWLSGVGSLPGNGGCGATPRRGIGSVAIGGVTRVGGAAGCGCGGRTACDFGVPGRPSWSENRGVGERGAGATFSGGGAIGFISCGFGGVGSATRWIGSRKRGPGTTVVPGCCETSRGTPRGGWLMIVWLMIVT